MKKIILTLVLVISLLALAACDGVSEEEGNKEEQDKKSEETVDSKDEESSDKKEEASKEEEDEKDVKEEKEEVIIEGTEIGDLALDFELKSFNDEKTYKLSNYRGKGPVIVKFFASYCGPCHAEMPALNEIYQEYNEKGLQVLAVNVGNNDNEQDVKALIDDYILEFPVLQDWESSTAMNYLVRAIPTNVFIDKNGVIVDYRMGLQTKEDYKEIVEKMLAD